VSKEQERRERQQELFSRRQEEAIARYSGSKGSTAVAQASARKVESYKRGVDLPKETPPNQIYIDTIRETIILPIFGFAVPFHISTIKNPSFTKADGDAYLRLNFVTPGQIGKDQLPLPIDPEINYIRELTYRSHDARALEEMQKKIKDLKKYSQEKEQKRKEHEDLVKQEELVISKTPSILTDVLIRPTLEGKKVNGTLFIHKNGIRYQATTGKRIDITFKNIKHLIFQPCDKEILVLIHIHLKNQIMLDKKKVKDIQFYREVIDSTVDETGNKRRGNFMDKDELGAEQEERRHRKKQNKEFKTFASQIAAMSEGSIELDEPFRELGFYGVPFRSNVLLQPTAHTLVHLSETPFFLVSMDEVEFAHFERIEHGLKNFDLVFVFKDYKKPPVHVSTISMQQLENIKDWLVESDVPFTESKTTLNWAQIMKHVNEDIPTFFEEGGWNFLLPDSENEDEEASESGSDFNPTDDEESEESEEDSSEEEYSDESASSEEGSDISTPDEESGDGWSDLEEKAAASDKKRSRSDEHSTRDALSVLFYSDQ